NWAGRCDTHKQNCGELSPHCRDIFIHLYFQYVLYTFICFLNVHRYASFFKMLQAESLEKVIPGVKTVEE
ncbi:hypothetical protein D5086_030052, partial [Populus alba]